MINKKIIILLICILLNSISIPAQLLDVSKTRDSENDPFITTFLVNGWVEQVSGVKILHLKGSFYEMGYQLGYFLKNEIQRNLRAFGLSANQSQYNTSELWATQKHFVPGDLVEYIQGTADAVGVSFDDIGCMWIWERNCSLHCASFIASGTATKNNELIHVYSLDFPSRPTDPVTGLCALDDPVLIVGEPDEGYAFLYPSFAGYVVESGMNEKGLAISNTASPCTDENDYGSPVGIRIFEALYTASSQKEAIQVLNSNRTYGYDFFISDIKNNEGYVLEQTAHFTYLGTWNSSCESNYPYYELDHIIRRTNCFLHPETAATQRTYYNPLDIRNVCTAGLSDMYVWSYYHAISKSCQRYIDEKQEKLNISTALQTIRDVFLNNSGGLVWFLLKITLLKHFIPWYQWAYTPRTGDLHICFTSQDKIASENPIIQVNFFELLEKN